MSYFAHSLESPLTTGDYRLWVFSQELKVVASLCGVAWTRVIPNRAVVFPRFEFDRKILAEKQKNHYLATLRHTLILEGLVML